MYVSKGTAKAAEDVFRKEGGTLRTSQALARGIHPRTLYYLRDNGSLIQLSRGVYRLANLPSLREPDLVTVAKRLPDAVVCLVSALAFHQLTTEIPHEVYVALTRSMGEPRLDYPPIRAFRFSDESFAAGVEEHQVDGVALRVYNVPKTVADCLKFRNKIGQDLAVEALRTALRERKATPADLMEYARVSRVESLMRTYLEALV